MNCDLCRRYLLATEEPAQPTGPAALHLAGCPVCRAWHARLVAVEGDLTKLPVPDSSAARARFLRRVRGTTRRGPVIAPRRWQPSVQERARRKLSVAMALAASLLVFAGGWWAWQQPQKPAAPQDSVARWEKEHVADPLRQAQSPRERVALLSRTAEDVQRDLFRAVDTKSTDADGLTYLAQCYRTVVETHLIREATALSESLNADERREVLGPLVARLVEMESMASQRASAQDTPKQSVAPLRAVAQAAAQGRDRIRALLPAA